jgi:tRNA A-37 threonylcarbamoyl transferase component Bud32
MSPAPRAVRRPGASPFTGKTLGRCVIAKPVGRGATATVFHALYQPLKKDVAVKILRADAAASPEARARFVEEARALAKLEHPHVVRVFDVVEDQGYLLIIMDFVEGRNLRQRIEEDGPLDPAEAVDIARQMALALDHAHSEKILHRDVKPGNVIVHDEGKAVLVDFGNAEMVGEAADRKGTAHYVAPEVFQGKRQDEKSDTYSLGATLFHMLTGQPPFDGQTVKDILKAHESGRLRAPSQVNPDGGIPKELDALVKRAMAPARGYRFAAKDLAAALEAVPLDAPSGQRRVRSSRARARASAERRGGPGPVLLLGAIVVLATAGGIAVALRAGDATPPPAPEGPAPLGPAAPATPPPEAAEKPPADFGIRDRAGAREARREAAEKAFAEARQFATTRGTDRPKEVADRYAAVAAEYGELESGRRAAEEEKFWRDRALTDTDRAAREAERRAAAEKERQAREAGLARVSAAVAAMKFEEALGALQEIEPSEPEAEAWKRRGERLNRLIGFAETLGEALRGEEVDGYSVQASFAKPGEKITDASASGLVMKNAQGQSRTVPWTEARPADVLALGRKVLRNAPEPRLTLACWCLEAGLRADAAKELDVARLTDRMGLVGASAEELFGPDLD